MAALTHAESRKLYSWWWASHISPKNSKWLQENLTDIDTKVKAMIKLIEEDADSFARKAEMYYKKRPELIKLVEEFYRAYRALAERYDHATGALRQTHKTMAEAFPNQIPFSLFDEPPGSYTSEGAPNLLDMLPSANALLDYDESQKDASNVSSPYLGIKRSAAYEDRNNKGLKQFSDLLGSGEDKLLAKSPGRMISQEDVSELSKENQHLKSQITSESARADTAEAQVHRLKETISKMTSEKEAVIRKSLSHSKENCEKLNREILMITEQLKSAEERHHLLEKSNTDVQLELDSIKQRAYEKQEELTKLQEELERLRCSLEEEHLQFLQAEAARLSAEKLHSQSQEEIRLLTRENQTGIEKLKDIEQRKLDLEEELQKLKIENGVLNEQHHASALEIINLQGVILLLRDSKSKLEEEIGIHVDEKKGLLEELARIKEDKINLERSCHQLTEQIETVNFNLEVLQVSVKELQTGNEELKEICLRHENEKILCLENMKGMEKIAEKNVILEGSLSDANAEIEGLREKIKTLEELRESLSGNVTVHTSEKAVLISQVETLSQDMQKLSERNIFLENSLQDETSEIEILNRKLKALEESYQILSAQSSDLHSEKSALASQVEETLQSLENLEASYAELELKHLNCGVEKDLALQQIMELEDSLKREKEEYETLILSIMLSRKSQLSSLEDQIYLLQEEGQLMKEEFEKEQQRVMDSQVENFILQRCLIDMNDKNSIISEECQKLVEASNSAEKLISELNRTVLAEEKKLASLTGSNEKLREGIRLMIREICHNNHGVPLDDTDDDSLLQLTLHEIRGLLKSFTDTLDENQHLLIEKSILVIILEQFGLNMADRAMREKALENVTESKTKELLLLQSKELELLAASEQLKTDLQVGNGRQEAQKSEMEVLFRQLRVLQEAHDTVQSENLKLLEEIQYMSKTSVDLREKMENLEEENSVILEEAMALETLFVIFKNSTIEKTTESRLMMKDLVCLRGVTDGLDRDITLLMEELLATEFENVYLKETVASLGECQRLFTVMEDDLSATRNVAKQFDLEIESGKALLAQKDSELFQANQTLSSTQSKNTDLRMTVEGLQLDINGALVQREELENTIFKLSENNEHMNNEISFLRLENGRLNEELDRLHKIVECLRSREEHLNSDLRKYVDEVNACETEIEMLMNDIQTRTVEAEVYEGKVLELLLTCENLEISAMVQKEMLYHEIARRTAIIDETKEKVDTTERENICLKEELNAYLLLETALWNDATSLEEQILYLASHCTSNLQETTDNQVASLHHLESNHEPNETMEVGILGLQKLHAKIQSLQKVVIDTGVLLEQEMVRSNASLKVAVEDIEVLESKGNSGQKEMQISEDIVQQENSQEGLRDNKLPNHDAQNSMMNSEQMMKDIPLDHVSPRREDGFHSYRSSLSENTGINDQDLIMWEQMESNSRNQSQKASSSLAWDDNESQQGSVVGLGRKKDTSEIVPVKVVSIDTQKLRKKNPDSHREHDIKVIGGLSSDAQRLSVLQTSVEELKKKMETSEMNESPRSFEFDTIKAQLKEAEASISQLIDTNSKLKKKAEEFFDSFAVAGYSEMQSNRKQNSERARKISEKVGRLELELHKIQYIFSKLTEEHEFKKDRAANRRRVMLKDYLYGRMDSRRRRRILCCMRPKTWED